jgi:uncharacterized protein (TIGR00255 family)
MIASMTGFGRALLDTSFGRIIVEIQSVNRKYIEIFVSMPKEYSRFEPDIRKWIGERISRGQVTVRVYLIPDAENFKDFLPNFEMLKQLKEGWEEVAHRLGYDRKSVDLSFLAQHVPIQSTLQMARDEDVDPFKTCTLQALHSLVEMKRKEGKALCLDIEQRLIFMAKTLGVIEAHAPEAVLRMKKKLQERILEAAPNLLEGDERVFREIAIFAEKVDITEELIRFRSHIVQFQGLLKETTAIGRKMEFLVQEMGREINTIGSKSLESKIAHLVVDVKSELEKVKEQIQNIE